MSPRAVAPVLAAGAVLRFATLDAQSLWYDEAVTARLLALDLGSLLQAIPDSESTPPLYYVLAWLWTGVFGTGEVGLRSLSALLGTATIAVAWAVGRRLGGDRAGVAAGALVAVNPLLVWFSQEARAYALLALLGTVSALLWLRALERPRATGRMLAWGAVAALALATHYYAIFLVVPQAAWLALRATGGRPRAAALALPAAAMVALAPLALGQRENDKAAFIGDSTLLTRLAQLPKQLLVGYDAPLEPLLAAVTALAFLAGIAGLAGLLAARIDAPRSARRDGARLAALSGVAFALPILAALAGEDHVVTRNLLAVVPLACVLAGAGLAAAARAAPRPAILALAGACAAGVVAVVGVARSPELQREDWRGAARALGPISAPRLIVATPASALETLRYYLPGVRSARAPTFTTAEIDHVALAGRRPGERPPPPRPAQPAPPAPGYVLADRTEGATYTVLRWQAPAPQPFPVGPAVGLDGEPAALLSVSSR